MGVGNLAHFMHKRPLFHYLQGGSNKSKGADPPGPLILITGRLQARGAATENSAARYRSSIIMHAFFVRLRALAAEAIGPGGPRPAHFLALVGRP